VAKVGTSKAGGTISQQAAVHPWLAADAHVQQQQQQQQHVTVWGGVKSFNVIGHRILDTEQHQTLRVKAEIY
jgi:hypothetical protein